MELKFFGTGSCFANDNNSAFFATKDRNLVIIDCSAKTFDIIKNKFDLSMFRNVYLYVTHTHPDHVGGVSIFIFYSYFVLQKKITVVAPSLAVEHDIKTLLKIEGVAEHMYTLTHVYDFVDTLITREHPIIPKSAQAFSVLTNHTPVLSQKCFGYVFDINGKKIVYTGDTNTLEPFFPFLNNKSELYVDTSCKYKSEAHLWLDEMLPSLLKIVNKGCNVYLMHLDDEIIAKNTIAGISGIEVVKIF